jgi:hypothetical protein
VVFIHNGIYSATKKNENLSFAGKWIELETIILSEVSQVQKAKSHIFSLSYVEYRPNTNTSNIMKNRLHLEKSHMRGVG